MLEWISSNDLSIHACDHQPASEATMEKQKYLLSAWFTCHFSIVPAFYDILFEMVVVWYFDLVGFLQFPIFHLVLFQSFIFSDTGYFVTILGEIQACQLFQEIFGSAAQTQIFGDANMYEKVTNPCSIF